jgi:hypothetical protein
MPELPNIVRQRLKASRPISAHPDPDVLTAFAEHSLLEGERAVVLEHLARCHDCRDILSLALPATVVVETARVPLPKRKGWFAGGFASKLGRPALRWGVVAAGFAVLAVAGILQYQRRQQETFIAARQTQAPAAQTTTAQVSRDGKSAKPTAGVPPAAERSANAIPADAIQLDAGSANAKNAESALAKERGSAASPVSRGASRPTTSKQQTPENSATQPTPGFAYGGSLGGPIKQDPQFSLRAASPAPVTVQAQAAPLTTNERVEVVNPPEQLEAKNQQEDRLAGRAGQPSTMDATVDKAKAPSVTVEVSSAATTLETVSAAPAASVLPSTLLASRWAISATGGLQRSFDQGRSWENVDVNANQSTGANLVALQTTPEYKKDEQTARDMAAQRTQSQAQSKTRNKNQSGQQMAKATPSIPVFRAVSANGLEVWAGGSAGMLYHSADGGQQWTRVVPSAPGVSLTGDVVGIAFADPQHGKIQTSTFELWTTTDAGQTWHKP